MNTKATGDIAEQAVVLAALQREWNVLQPVGDRLPYDLVLEKDNYFVKIQVKSAWHDKNRDNYVVDNRRTKTNRRTMLRSKYTKDDFDFAIAYIDELQVFYIFPVAVFTAYASEIHLVEASKRQRKPESANYRDAWHLISEGLTS